MVLDYVFNGKRFRTFAIQLQNFAIQLAIIIISSEVRIHTSDFERDDKSTFVTYEKKQLRVAYFSNIVSPCND